MSRLSQGGMCPGSHLSYEGVSTIRCLLRDSVGTESRSSKKHVLWEMIVRGECGNRETFVRVELGIISCLLEESVGTDCRLSLGTGSCFSEDSVGIEKRLPE